MSVRVQVADVVNAAAIPEVAGLVWPPGSRAAGMVWAQWSATEYRQGLRGSPTADRDEWQVWLTLPGGDPAATASARDRWEPQVVAALGPIARVTRSEPTAWTVEDGGAAVPAVLISIVMT